MENKSKSLLIIIGSLLVLTIGLTYAYYSAMVHGTGNTNAEASGTTATLGEVEFNGDTTFDTTNIGRDIYPGFIGVQSFTIEPYKDGHGIYEIDLEANVPAAFGNDIKITLYKTSDATNNNIESEEGSLTIVNNRYTKQDTLTITGTLTKVYEGSLTDTDETMLEQVEFLIENDEFSEPDTTPDDYYTYYVVYEYLDNGNQNNQQGLDFDSKITVKYIEEISYNSLMTLTQLQALNNTITITPSTISNPDFSKIAPSDEFGQTSGLYEMEDDYGTSYYFRGDIVNNYVKFGKWQTDWYKGTADNYSFYSSLNACETASEYNNCDKIASVGDDMYWRIIRINGDGSIRMIYDGKNAFGLSDIEDPWNNVYRSIGESYYNYTRISDIENTYVGYMYGTPESSTYEATHANIHDSTIKMNLDNWYQSQMLGYSNFIADGIFCNDRSVARADTINFRNEGLNPSEYYTSSAFGNNNALYGGYGRLIDEADLLVGNRATFKCPQKNDAFTVSDTINGNGALTYPVGLMTIDEFNAAGGSIYGENNWYYLNVGAQYFGMSPDDSNNIFAVGYNGDHYTIPYVNPSSLRPVINLKPGSINAGDGTALNPFRIE